LAVARDLLSVVQLNPPLVEARAIAGILDAGPVRKLSLPSPAVFLHVLHPFLLHKGVPFPDNPSRDLGCPSVDVCRASAPRQFWFLLPVSCRI